MPAANQLQNIFEYIAVDNKPAAYRTVRRIREAILLTGRMPYFGRVCRTEGTREITVSGTSYLVAYRIVDNMIHVLAILHGARQWPEAF
jgi:plasmid stabilization system protein ParE